MNADQLDAIVDALLREAERTGSDTQTNDEAEP